MRPGLDLPGDPSRGSYLKLGFRGPDEIADAWYTATSQIGQLGALAAPGYDLEVVPQAQLELLVAGIDTPAADDEEHTAAIDALAAWFTTNCAGAITTEPNFTG